LEKGEMTSLFAEGGNLGFSPKLALLEE